MRNFFSTKPKKQSPFAIRKASAHRSRKYFAIRGRDRRKAGKIFRQRRRRRRAHEGEEAKAKDQEESFFESTGAAGAKKNFNQRRKGDHRSEGAGQEEGGRGAEQAQTGAETPTGTDAGATQIKHRTQAGARAARPLDRRTRARRGERTVSKANQLEEHIDSGSTGRGQPDRGGRRSRVGQDIQQRDTDGQAEDSIEHYETHARTTATPSRAE